MERANLPFPRTTAPNTAKPNHMATQRKLSASYPSDANAPNAPRYICTLQLGDASYTNGIWETRDGALRLGREWRCTRTIGSRKFVELSSPAASAYPTSAELAAAIDDLVANLDGPI